ncbi:uncharacterized protein LOC124284506 [Haliotis rubra]|uniref:uncharacterized protein LOC124284506 n=1 Tax=Haliotis rubra TaxID=36100 RepID=UPI001EE53053|nr:uncharacterized protein LOC124284506 [Haliotis rubra]
MMDYRDKFKDDVFDRNQQMDAGSSCGDLAEPRVISHCACEDLDSDAACSLYSDDSDEQESMCVFTENGQSYHAKNNYSTSPLKYIDGEFSIGLRETISSSPEYCIRNSFVTGETANRHSKTMKAALDKSKRRRSRIQTVVIIAAFVLSSIVLLCVLVLALV